MTGFLASLHSAWAWLHAQATALFSMVSAMITNKPAPARQVLVYTLVLIALAWAAPKIAKLARK